MTILTRMCIKCSPTGPIIKNRKYTNINYPFFINKSINKRLFSLFLQQYKQNIKLFSVLMHLLYILYPALFTDFPRLQKTIVLCGELIDRMSDKVQVWF